MTMAVYPVSVSDRTEPPGEPLQAPQSAASDET